MEANYIMWIQNSLNKAMRSNLRVDGRLGPQTNSAIIAFQRSRGLASDGLVGPQTERALIAVGAGSPPARHLIAVGAGSPPARPTHRHKQWVTELTPLLNKYRGDIPIEFLLGWIDVESSGRIEEQTTLDERGYFQIHPDESRALGLQHGRLTIDSEYSIQSGIKLVNKYAQMVNSRGYARGTDLFWHLVKFYHAIGSGAAKGFLDDMQRNGVTPTTWAAVQQYAQQNDTRLLHQLKHSPAKWVHNVNELFARGRTDLALAAHH